MSKNSKPRQVKTCWGFIRLLQFLIRRMLSENIRVSHMKPNNQQLSANNYNDLAIPNSKPLNSAMPLNLPIAE